MTQPEPQPPLSGSRLPGGATGDPAAKLDAVREAEITYLWWHRHASKANRDEVANHLVGLALSGGGIRSATTCLGVLQALSKMQILPLVDYLSTVSGGGYIGACLSSLLSLTEQDVTRSPDQPPRTWTPPGKDSPEPTPPFTYQPNDRPGFSTEWRAFPFRAERRDWYGRLGTDLVAHLRTHGNFLVARRGLFKRDAMRAVGHLLTGISYNLGMFVGTLFVLSAIMMAAARYLAPGLQTSLTHTVPVPVEGAANPAGPDAPAEPPDTIWRNRVASDSSMTRVRTLACEPETADCTREISTTLQVPSYWQRGLRIGRILAAEAGAALQFFLWPVIAGAVLSLLIVAGVVGGLRWYLRGGVPSRAKPHPGESKDDSFEVGVLWGLCLMAILVVIGVTWFMRSASSPEGNRQLLLLFVPLAVLLGARMVSFGYAVLGSRFTIWTRRFRSIWGAYQAITIYGWWIMLVLALLPLAAFALHDYRTSLGFSAVGTLLLTRLLASRLAIVGRGKLRLSPGFRHGLLAIAVLLVMALGLIFFGSILVDVDNRTTALAAAFGVVLFAAFGYMVDHNKLSPHYFYGDRLAETYLLSELADTEGKLHTFRDTMEMPLASLHGKLPEDVAARPWRNPAPYHLINAAINLGASRDLTRKDRKSVYWLFSKLYCGSTHTGFRPTAAYRRCQTKLARAVGISGAAASSAIGTATFFAQAFATVLFNIRLGYWMENPLRPESLERQEGRKFWPYHLWQELSMGTTEHGRLVNLSDGGHTGDNVGIYPLFQRCCKVIIACDAERDPTLGFGSFTEALRHAYVDLGVNVDIDLTMIRPDPATGYSRSHCAVGRVHYPDAPDQESFLIYLKNSLTGDEPEPILNYKSAQPAFPHETTVDQFFDDAQFESYRALGVHLAEHTFGQWNTTVGFDYVRRQQWPG
jgi:hypothetical protein